jgi:predicted transglutaminase-like protease
MASESVNLTETMFRNFIRFCKTENYGFADLETCQKWLDKLAEFLIWARKTFPEMELPNGYKCNDPGIIIIRFQYVVIPKGDYLEPWINRWAEDFVGYANYLFTLISGLTTYKVAIPKWRHNNNTSWLL